MRKKFLTLLFVAAASCGPLFAANEIPSIGVKPAGGPIAVDGELEAGLERRNPDRDLVGDQPGRQPPGEGEERRVPDLRRPVPLRGFRVLRSVSGKIRAPYADRDNVNSSTDYGGIILDTQNDGKPAILFLANPRGIQYDANTDDAER